MAVGVGPRVRMSRILRLRFSRNGFAVETHSPRDATHRSEPISNQPKTLNQMIEIGRLSIFGRGGPFGRSMIDNVVGRVCIKIMKKNHTAIILTYGIFRSCKTSLATRGAADSKSGLEGK